MAREGSKSSLLVGMVGFGCLVGCLMTVLLGGSFRGAGRGTAANPERQNKGHEHAGMDSNASRAEIAAFGASLQSLEQRAVQGSDAPQKKQAPPPLPPSSPLDGLEPRERDQAIAEHLNSALEQEPKDASWQSQAEETLTGSIAALEGAHLHQLRCATSFCRASISHESTVAQEEQMHKLIADAPWHAGGFVLIENQDAPTSTWYFAREGHTLPEMLN